MNRYCMRASLVLVGLLSTVSMAAEQNDPLPSWNDGPRKQAIINFVERVTTKDSPEYVPPAERIATFDNDGCLWSEQPVYFQLLFALDQVKAEAAEHPEWKTTEPYKSAINGDMQGLMASGKEGLLKVMAVAHVGMTSDEFRESARKWLATARHPKTGRRYTEMVYQPMLELLDYLRDNDFKTFIVSGGGIDFLRVFAEETYGIPPEQVVGSSLGAKYQMRDDVPTIVKVGADLFVDDKAGKPIGIYQHIGRRPIFAAGNSDGDYQMLEYTTVDHHPSFGLIVHHTDAQREFAYDRQSHIGQLDKALDDAPKRGWQVVDMKNDWKVIWPPK